LIPIGISNPSIDSAIEAALAQVPEADAISDAVTYNEVLIAFLYHHDCWRIEGTAIRTREAGVPRAYST
jgi:hypothetical protein